jgi:hypothetical protein
MDDGLITLGEPMCKKATLGKIPIKIYLTTKENFSKLYIRSCDREKKGNQNVRKSPCRI